MELTGIIDRARAQLAEVVNLKISNIIGAQKKEDGWHVAVELIERQSVPDTQDILGVYEVLLDDQGRMLSYERKRVRRRAELEVPEE